MNKLKLGLIITLVSWVISWGKLFPPLNQFMFFPLWFGYVLTINGISEYLLGASLMKKMKGNFTYLFFISAPFWWVFEAINRFLNNWQYILPQPVSKLEYLARASINFSTVVPAVMSTSFLFFNMLKKIRIVKGPKFKFTRQGSVMFIEIGVLLLATVIFYPRIGFPFTWLSIFLIIDPINHLLGLPSLLNKLKSGNWTLLAGVASGMFFTAFFWEMWNYYASPKWVYNIPFVEVFKIFEMPILGYLGYPFFGLEVYAYTNLAFGVLKKFNKRFKFSLG
jgi:hypothetical protein